VAGGGMIGVDGGDLSVSGAFIAVIGSFGLIRTLHDQTVVMTIDRVRLRL